MGQLEEDDVRRYERDKINHDYVVGLNDILKDSGIDARLDVPEYDSRGHLMAEIKASSAQFWGVGGVGSSVGGISQRKLDSYDAERRRAEIERKEWEKNHPEEVRRRREEEREKKEAQERLEAEQREKQRDEIKSNNEEAEELIERIRIRLANKKRLLYPLGAVFGGLWFAFFDAALNTPEAYGGYWYVIGINVLLCGVLVFILQSLGRGLKEGSSTGCGVLMVFAIPVWLIGYFVRALPSVLSVAAGVACGLYLGKMAVISARDWMFTASPEALDVFKRAVSGDVRDRINTKDGL